jgi:uncharacterized membrane protein
MTSIYWTLLLLRYFHILGAITLMGGTIFAYFAAAPGLAELPEPQRNKVHAAIRSRFNRLVMIATAALLVSGLISMLMYPLLFNFGEMSTAYRMWTGIKFLLGLPIFYIAAMLAGRSELAKKVQANARTFMAINLVLALCMVLIGGALRFVDRTPAKGKSGETVARPVKGESLPWFPQPDSAREQNSRRKHGWHA